MDLEKIPAVILCGGKSSRMKQDKCFLKIKNKSLIQYQYEKLNKIFKKVYISTKIDKFDKKFPNLILDDEALYSPMLAIYTSLKTFNDSFVFICAVDMPNISKIEIQALFEKINLSKAVIPKTKDGIHFLCGFYHSSLSSLCENFLKKDIHKIKLFAKEAKAYELEFKNDKAFLNLNFYEDYLKNV